MWLYVYKIPGGVGEECLQVSIALGINLQLIPHANIIILLLLLLISFFVFLGIVSSGKTAPFTFWQCSQSFFWITGHHFASFSELLDCWENHGGLGCMDRGSTAGNRLWVHASPCSSVPLVLFFTTWKKEQSCQNPASSANSLQPSFLST